MQSCGILNCVTDAEDGMHCATVQKWTGGVPGTLKRDSLLLRDSYRPTPARCVVELRAKGVMQTAQLRVAKRITLENALVR